MLSPLAPLPATPPAVEPLCLVSTVSAADPAFKKIHEEKKIRWPFTKLFSRRNAEGTHSTMQARPLDTITPSWRPGVGPPPTAELADPVGQRWPSPAHP